MRPIARAVGIPVSSLYRFYDDHAELMASLRVDSYQELIHQLEDSRDASAELLPSEQWRVIAHGLRTWALANPDEFSLLFTAPTHGIDIWTESIAAERSRAVSIVGKVLEAAAAAGELSLDITGSSIGSPHPEWLGSEGPLSPEIVQLTLGSWSALVGHLSMESRRSSVVDDSDVAYEDFMRGVMRGMGLAIPERPNSN